MTPQECAAAGGHFHIDDYDVDGNVIGQHCVRCGDTK